MLKTFLIVCAFACLGQTIPLIERNHDQIETKIIGGVNATQGEMPWMVSLQYDSFGIMKHFCGGVLLNSTHVLTAAHCLKDVYIQYVKIVAGTVRIFANSATEQVRTPSMKRVHEGYISGPPVRHDLAILEVDRPFEFNQNVQALALPPRGHHASGLCQIAGWGAYSSQNSQSDFLLKTDVPIVTRTRCLQIYGSNLDPETQICAGYDAGGHDSCQGDTGGPIVCTDTLGYKYIGGISSWGYSCGVPNAPGVYSEASVYTIGAWQPVYLDLPEF